MKFLLVAVVTLVTCGAITDAVCTAKTEQEWTALGCTVENPGGTTVAALGTIGMLNNCANCYKCWIKTCLSDNQVFVVETGDCTNLANAATISCTNDNDETVLTCDPGYYGSVGGYSCDLCLPGRLTDTGELAGATTCTTCTPGKYSLTSKAAFCSDCTPITNAETVQCTTDSNGNLGPSQVGKCEPGYSTNEVFAATQCVECLPGSLTDTGTSNGATKCTPCDAGTYSLTSKVATCTDCEPITTAATVQCTTASDETIVTCKPDFYGAVGDAECVECLGNGPAGSNFLERSGQPSWSYTEAGATDCKPCISIPNANKTQCTKEDDATISTCNPGYYGVVGAATCEQCTNPSGATCDACSGQDVCTAITCVANKFNTNTDIADGCEVGCPVVENGICDTCSDKNTAADGYSIFCTTVTCDLNTLDANNNAIDGCEETLTFPAPSPAPSPVTPSPVEVPETLGEKINNSGNWGNYIQDIGSDFFFLVVGVGVFILLVLICVCLPDKNGVGCCCCCRYQRRIKKKQKIPAVGSKDIEMMPNPLKTKISESENMDSNPDILEKGTDETSLSPIAKKKTSIGRTNKTYSYQKSKKKNSFGKSTKKKNTKKSKDNNQARRFTPNMPRPSSAATRRFTATALEAAAVLTELSPSPALSLTPPPSIPTHWNYQGAQGTIQGPFETAMMKAWYMKDMIFWNLTIRDANGPDTAPFIQLGTLYPDKETSFTVVGTVVPKVNEGKGNTKALKKGRSQKGRTQKMKK